MTRILFVCLGNICRSVMSEMILKHLAQQNGREKDFYIESAATSNYEIGNDIYPPAKRCLTQHHIPFTHHAARQVTRDDYQRFDLILLMDYSNMKNIAFNFGNDVVMADRTSPSPKIRMLMEYVRTDRRNVEVADPYSTLEVADLENKHHINQPFQVADSYSLEVADPYYTGDFEATYRDVFEACQYLITNL